MRISIIYLGRRGAGGKISFELARALSRVQDVFVVLSRQAENLNGWGNLLVERVEVHTYRGAVGALASLLFPAAIQRVAKMVRQATPDMLLFPLFHPWNAIIQRKLSMLPSVVFVHDPRPHPDLTGWFYEKLENASIRRAARCVVMSEALKPALVQRGVSPEKIDVIPLGLFEYNTASRPKKTPNAYPTLLFFGRVVPYKGVDTLLEAVAGVAQYRPVHLLLAGEGNLKPFRSLLNAIPSTEIINRWIGEDEIASIFSRADLVVLPYTSASQSGIIPLAAGFSLPVIATQTGGIPEQIRHGYSGWLVQPGSAQALAEMIDHVLNHPMEAEAAGQRLYEEYAHQRNWNKIARMVSHSLETAIKEHKG